MKIILATLVVAIIAGLLVAAYGGPPNLSILAAGLVALGGAKWWIIWNIILGKSHGFGRSYSGVR